MFGKMRAGVFTGPREIRVMEIDVPPAEAGHVLIENKVSGICGSDIHRYYGKWEQPEGLVATGHELSGVIVQVGEGVSELKIGDRVCAECFSHCGHCAFCSTGRYNLCENIRYISWQGHGGFAEYSLIPDTSLFKLPPELSFEEGALIEPLAVSYRSILRTQPGALDRVAILGAGTIGLLCLLVAKVIGVEDISVTAKYEHQVRMAESLGADHVVRATTQDLREDIRSRSELSGMDVVVDTVATEETFDDALAIVRKAGKVCLLGGYTGPLSLRLRPIVSKELHVLGSSCYGYSGLRKDFDSVIKLVASGRLDATPVITHRFPLEEIGEAFKVAADKTTGSIKVLLHP